MEQPLRGRDPFAIAEDVVKLLFVVRNPSFFYQYRLVVDELCRGGHCVEFLLFDSTWQSAGMGCELLEVYRNKYPGRFGYVVDSARVGSWTRLLRAKREIVNFAAYHKENPISTSAFMRERARSWLPRGLRAVASLPGAGRLSAWPPLLRALEFLEALFPPEVRYTRVLRDIEPDIVVGSPYVFTNSREIDYVRAAQRSGIRTAAIIYSWDNLTTKGLLQVWPERIFVWNQDQVRELERIHSFPADNVVVAGAPALDFWFEHRSSTTKTEFLHDLGVDGDRSIVTYLCSSRTIAPQEKDFVNAFAQRFNHILGERYLLVVRPHPQNEGIWEGVESSDYLVAPRITSDMFRNQSARDRFFAQLKFSECVVGMNTTAILEALILGRPSISILSADHRETQADTPHFQHLANSGVVTICAGFDEACRAIAQVSSGGTAVEARRREKSIERFVQEFIRPQGRGRPASVEIARTLLAQCGLGQAESPVKESAASTAQFNQ